MKMSDFLHARNNISVDARQLKSVIKDAKKVLEGHDYSTPLVKRMADFIVSLDGNINDLELQKDCEDRFCFIVMPEELMGGAPLTAYLVQGNSEKDAREALKEVDENKDEKGYHLVDEIRETFKPTVEFVRTNMYDMVWVNRRFNGEACIVRSIMEEENPFRG